MADPTAPQTTPLFGVPLNGQPAAPTVTPVAPKKYQEQDGKHRGVAGVARDILGTLGDFLLTRLHMPAMYAPAQKARKLAAAQANIDTDPVGSIQQVSSIDPVFGAKLRDQYIDNSRLAASQASTAEARDARLAQAAALQSEKNRNTSASYLGSLVGVPEKDRATNYAAIRSRLLSRYGTSDPQLANDLPQTYDPVSVDAFIDGAVPVGTQRSQRLQKDRDAATDADRDATRGERIRHNKVTEDQGADRVGIARSRAEIASRPKPPRAPRFTEGDIASGLIDRQAAGKPLSAGQRARVNKYIHGTSRPKAGDVVTLPDGRRVKLTK